MKSHRNKVFGLTLLAILFLLVQIFQPSPPIGESSEDINQRRNPISLTKHARCRMHCRSINLAEVEEAITFGEVNQRKSNNSASPCPVIAKEIRTRIDGQKIRVVYGACEQETKIITVIDLGEDHPCSCE